MTLNDESRPVASDPGALRFWVVLIVVPLAQLTIGLYATVIWIALPSAQADLGFSTADRQWVVTAYTLAFGSLLLLGGRLADRFGPKRVLLAGLSGFAAASIVGGAAPEFATLVLARGAQGMFAALVAPATLALLTTTFASGRWRGIAFGIFGACGASGSAIGVLAGGVVTEYLSWRWCLYLTVPLVLFTLAGVLLLPGGTSRPTPGFDLPGVLTVSGGLVCLVYGLSEAASHGWTAPVTLSSLTAATGLLVTFIVIERRAARPILPLDIVWDSNRGSAIAAMLLASASLFGLMLTLTYYLQDVVGFSAARTGLAFLPLLVTITLVQLVVSGSLVDASRARVTIPGGLVLTAFGYGLLTRVDAESTYRADILGPLALLGVGLGVTLISAISLSTYAVRVGKAGVAGAVVQTAQQVGGTTGTALFSTIAAGAYAGYLAARSGGDGLHELATVHSSAVTFGVSSGISAAGAVLTFLLLRAGRGGRLSHREAASASASSLGA